jgi:hypothetical protein
MARVFDMADVGRMRCCDEAARRWPQGGGVFVALKTSTD